MNNMIKVTNCSATVFVSICVTGTKKMCELFDEHASEHPELNLTYKVFKAGEMPLEELPKEIQEKVKSTLRAFHSCTVTYEHSKFSVSTGTCIRATYDWDHFVAGTYKDDEVYTIEERRQNYEEEFGYAPCF